MPRIPAAQVSLHWSDLDTARLEGVDLACLDDTERQRMQRLRGDLLQRRFAAAHVMMRQNLGRVAGLPARDLRIEPDSLGKPQLCNAPLHFSLSHSGRWAVLGIATLPLGVDLEARIQPDRSHLAREILSAPELERWLALPDEDLQSDFLTASWCAKEAALKATGWGLREAPNQLAVELPLPSRVTVPPHATPLWVHPLSAPEGFAAALAIGLPPPLVLTGPG